MPEQEYLAIQVAKQDVLFATLAEETFAILTENFHDFEIALLRAAQTRIASGLGDYHESMSLRLEIDRKLLNILTAAKLYLDQTSYILCELFGSNSNEQKQLLQFRSEIYDGCFGYRVMEALRNYVQHRGLAVGRIACNQLNVRKSAEPLWEISIVPELSSSDLAADPKFKRSVAKEMIDLAPFLDVRPMLREYVSRLSETHSMFQGIVDQRFTLAVNRLRKHIRDVPNAEFLAAVEQGDSGEIIHRIALPEIFFDRAEQLRKRSNGLVVARASYVSSAPR